MMAGVKKIWGDSLKGDYEMFVDGNILHGKR